jgi:muramoyltetrapeptide carboxypeptidase LdcA involved in peptidoglycan recycling
MKMIASLPEGIGVQKQQNGLDLRIESDGEGGLMVTAQTEGKEQVTIERTLTENQEVNDTLKEDIIPEPSFWERAKGKVMGICLACLLLLIGTRWLKSKLKNNLKSD